MRPHVVVVGETYDDARRYILANREARPMLQNAVVLSATAEAARVDGLPVAKVVETPGARFGRNYTSVMATLRRSAEKPCNTVPLT